MRTVVRSQIERLLAALGDLQPETARRKSLRRFHIRSSQANIADVFQIDHCFFSRLLAHAGTQLRYVLGIAAPFAKRFRSKRKLARRTARGPDLAHSVDI